MRTSVLDFTTILHVIGFVLLCANLPVLALGQVSVVAGEGATIALTNTRVKVSGSWSSQGTFASDSSIVEFTGSGQHGLSHTGTGTFSDLHVDMIEGQVRLQSDLMVDGVLRLTRGILNLNGYTVDLGNTGTLEETDSGRVTGTSGTIKATRVLGAPDSVNIAGLGAIITSSVVLDTISVTRGHAVQTSGDGSVSRYFDISPATNSSLDAHLVFTYRDAEVDSVEESSLQLFRSEDGGISWIEEGGVLDTVANTITHTSIEAFSRWTAAPRTLSNAMPFPIPPNAGTELLLLQNYPNPFNPETILTFSVPEPGQTILLVYDVSGKVVARLFDGQPLPGKLYHFRFDGRQHASGLYLYALHYRGQVKTRQMLLVK